MALPRSLICAPPFVYLLRLRCALDQARLADPQALAVLLEQLALIQRVFALRYYAWNIGERSWSLVLRHRQHFHESDQVLQDRWASLGNQRSSLRGAALRQRMSSLSGLMQTLLHQASRRLTQCCGGPGTWWAPRYRACLLADDSALIAAVCAVEEGDMDGPSQLSSRHCQRSLEGSPLLVSGQPASILQSQDLADSRGGGGKVDSTSSGLSLRPTLAPLPLNPLPDGSVVARDAAPLGISPPQPDQEQLLYERCLAGITAEQRRAYAQVLKRAWVLGRPESLADAQDRMGRTTGRGRSRRLRELDDELGLCGVWG